MSSSSIHRTNECAAAWAASWFLALYFVQDFVSLVDSRAKLLLASKARRVFEIPDDAPILEM